MTTLEDRITRIEQRNKNVELDKAWETSWTRRGLIALFTYMAIALYLKYIVETADPWINAIIPTTGFLLSTLTLPYFKNLWTKIIYKR